MTDNPIVGVCVSNDDPAHYQTWIGINPHATPEQKLAAVAIAIRALRDRLLDLDMGDMSADDIDRQLARCLTDPTMPIGQRKPPQEWRPEK